MTLVCKDKDGNVLSEQKQILERWQQYFKELLNPEAERITSIETHEEPTYEEISEIIKNMKPNKAAGPDYILPEVIKKGGLTLKQKIFKLIVKIWKHTYTHTSFRRSVILSYNSRT